jgi:hypothetical protein
MDRERRRANCAALICDLAEEYCALRTEEEEEEEEEEARKETRRANGG